MWYNEYVIVFKSNQKEKIMAKRSSKTTRNAGKLFSTKAVGFLMDNAGFLTASSIAGRLGRTTKSVRRKAEKLGVSLALNS